MKKSYSTWIKLKYLARVLQPEYLKMIPTSTRSYWRNLDISRIIGINDANRNEIDIDFIKNYIQDRKLREYIKAMVLIYFVLFSILSKVKNLNKILFDAKGDIVEAIEKTKYLFGINRSCRAFGISTQKYYSWKNIVNCIDPLNQYCKRVIPNQLTFKEQNIIKKYLVNIKFSNWNISNIYYKMIINRSAFMSISTFRKYANIFFPKRKLPANRKKIKKIGIRAKKPFEKIHMDVTIFRPLDNTKVYIYIIVDNFSRKILSWKASLELSADIAFENLRNAIEKHGIFDKDEPTELIVDGGSENKGKVSEYVINSKDKLKKLVAKKDIIFSNSLIEAVNKIMKYYYLFKQDLVDINHVIKHLEFSVPDYNCRPHSVLGISPDRAANNEVFDIEKYKEDMEKVFIERIKENKNCNKCNKF